VADFVFSTLLCISCLLYHPEHLQLQYFCLPPDACPNLSDGSLTSSLSLTVSVFIEAEVLVITQFICNLVLSTFVPQVWHHCWQRTIPLLLSCNAARDSCNLFPLLISRRGDVFVAHSFCTWQSAGQVVLQGLHISHSSILDYGSGAHN